jgi:Peptide-N-glycosidase F, C terminal/Secretion system C-terminal sorting domain
MIRFRIAQFILALAFFLQIQPIQAAPGDTTVVQTFTFGSAQNGWFAFPADSNRYERILMYYTLRCVPGNSPSCGEWDYLTYSYLWQHTGVMDSTVTSIDTLLNDTTWNVFEVVNRFEIGRYITPYGIGLNLGNDGWTWVFDVSDYKPLLHDSVHLSAGNWQEQLDLKFMMIEGIPPRDVIRLENVWSGGHDYSAAIESQFLTPVSTVIQPGEEMARLKIRTTGHGFGGTDNCAEFCPTNNNVIVNGTDTLHQYLWRDDCGWNPLFPQGGTWIYDRANWCPGAEVRTDEFELTPWLVSGDTLTVDYDMQAGYVWDGNGSTPYYVIEGQLVTYSSPNYQNEVSMEEIIAPSDGNLTRRYNPVCDAPLIRIRNNGEVPLTSLTIQYGPSNSTLASFNWTGNLGFLEADTISLPPLGSQTLYTDSVFHVMISAPSGQTDENPENNFMWSRYQTADITDSLLILAILANVQGQENWWTIEDASGNLFYSVDSLIDNNYSQDTFHLPNGCYKFTLGDRDEDGISFFAHPEDGTGWIKFFDRDMHLVKNITPNFGSRIEWWFRVDASLSRENPLAQQPISVYPNPGSGWIHISSGLHKLDHNAVLFDLTGREVATSLLDQKGPGEYETTFSNVAVGTYLLQVKEGQAIIYSRLVISE